MDALKDNIKILRLLHGLTQKDLAIEIDCATSTLSNWEKGIISPNAESLLKLCEVFDCTPNQLLGIDKIEELESYRMSKEAVRSEVDKLQKQRTELDARIKAYQKLISRS